MYLKSLEVHGFKSFANKLVFEFHNGITAIVGPNGSGKSNVADAVRWVLGEQSAKQLRGAKMEDVIFAGTQLRKPLGYAYVAITINNEDHKLNVPYEEVTIARRVYRSGESEYLLNGASCRLKDVQELLFDTGIGKEGYSIIGQGQIDKILSGKPEERRELFDEAAGIVKFKKRKAAAEKNLDQEQQNMVRIEDILSELEKQVGPLEKQSEKAKEYLKYRDELRNLDVNLFLSEYDSIHEEMEETEKRLVIATEDLKKTEEDYEKIKKDYLEVEQSLENYNQNLENDRERLSEIRLLMNQQNGEEKLLQEQIRAAGQNESHYQEQIEKIKQDMEISKQEKKGYEEKQKQADAEVENIQQKQEKTGEEVREITQKIQETEKEILACNNAMLEAVNASAEVRADEQRYSTMLEQVNVKKAELTKRVLENKSEAAGLQETMEKQKAALLEISDKIRGMDANNEEIKGVIKQIEEEKRKSEAEYQNLQRQYHMQNSRLNSLKDMTERYDGFGQSIRRVMEQKKNYPGIIGVVADIIRVDKEYEIAVETALGGSIQNIVTDNEQTAKAMIGMLKKNRYGRATFLPLTNISARDGQNFDRVMQEAGVIGKASTLVDADAQFHGLIEYLLGRFVVVDNIDHAIALAKKYHHSLRIVTKEGELLNPGGSMSGGAYKNNNNLLGRRREMENLETQVSKFRQDLQDLNKKMQKAEDEKEKQEKRMEDNKKIQQELFLQQNTAKINYDRAKGDFLKNQDELNHIRLDGQEIEEQKKTIQTELDELRKNLSDSEEENKDKEKRASELSEKLEEWKKEEKDLNEKNQELLLQISTKSQGNQFLSQNMNRIAQKISELEEELARAERNCQDASALMRQKIEEKDQIANKLEECKKEIEELEAKIQKNISERDSLSKKHKGFFDQREELSEKKSALDKECFRLNNQKEKMQEKLDYSTNYMWEQYELTYHAAEELKTETEFSLAQMKQEISALKNKMKNLGDVNVNAIEQYKEVSERYELLKSQHEDLITATKTLEKIIAELDEEMRKQFETQFEEIRKRFDKVFRELFGGGRGALELIEDEDVLTAGIRIVAQPPGKKLQNMMQMSGGEKSLTAIALLFAIQSLKPSPFCLLDEIEAALDDSNVTRYAEYLHKLTKDTQFIVITHRRGTMKAADILYGITMQEKGVSTLVSVNMLDEKEIAN